MTKSSSLANWTLEQVAFGKKWAETWRLAAADLEHIKRKEIRELDTYKTIALLCHSPDRAAVRAKAMVRTCRTTRWFKKAAGRE
jgi:hypothetical protein